MRKLTLQKTLSFIGMAALVGLVFFTAFAGSISCKNQVECTGTDFSDNMVDSVATEIMHGYAGDDSLISEQQIQTPSKEAREQVFGDGGNDTMQLHQIGNVYALGGAGNDEFRLWGKKGSESYTVDGGRGDDFIQIVQALGNSRTTRITDGPGQDTILDNTGDSVEYAITLIADNEADTVRLSDDGNSQTIKLSKDSGRDVIDCGDTTHNDGDMVILNGNRKAVDAHGNNLYKAAIRGGTAQSNCQTIMQ